MGPWLKTQIEKRGLFKALLLLWMMVIVSVVIIWFLIQPEKLGGIMLTIGGGVIGLVATVIAAVFKSSG